MSLKPIKVSGEQLVRALGDYQAHALNRTVNSLQAVQWRVKDYGRQVRRAGVAGPNVKNKRGIRDWKPATEEDTKPPLLANAAKLPKCLHWRCVNPQCHFCEPDGGTVAVRCPCCGKNREPILGRKDKKLNVLYWMPEMIPPKVKKRLSAASWARKRWRQKNREKCNAQARERLHRKKAEEKHADDPANILKRTQSRLVRTNRV